MTEELRIRKGKKHMIQVFAARLPEGDVALPEDMPRPRLVRCARLVHSDDRRRAASSHKLLRIGLDTFAGRRVSLDSWTETERGKPFLAKEPGLHFSIAHSGEMVLCAIADSPVGADIEALRPVSPALLHKFACPGELDALETEGFRAENILSLWTRKESYGKFLGVGIGHSRIFQAFLWRKSVTPPPENACLTDLSLPYGYLGAVCCRDPLINPVCLTDL